MPDHSFVTYLIDQLAPWGAVRARAMFGGWGLYHHERMFALVADDQLYIKVDDLNRAAFEQAGSVAFVPFPDKPLTMNYYSLPENALDDPEALAHWAELGHQAAQRAAKKAPKRRSPRTG